MPPGGEDLLPDGRDHRSITGFEQGSTVWNTPLVFRVEEIEGDDIQPQR
jgi:hypothetical protein